MRHIPANPAAELALPKYENRLAVWNLREEDVQRRSRPILDRPITAPSTCAGLRVSEACDL
jgi:hypothetical protein